MVDIHILPPAAADTRNSKYFRGLRRRHRFHGLARNARTTRWPRSKVVRGGYLFAEASTWGLRQRLRRAGTVVERLGQSDTISWAGTVLKDVGHRVQVTAEITRLRITQPAYFNRGPDISPKPGECQSRTRSSTT